MDIAGLGILLGVSGSFRGDSAPRANFRVVQVIDAGFDAGVSVQDNRTERLGCYQTSLFPRV